MSVLSGSECQLHTQVAIISEDDPRYPLDRRLVAPRSVLEALMKRQVSCP